MDENKSVSVPLHAEDNVKGPAVDQGHIWKTYFLMSKNNIQHTGIRCQSERYEHEFTCKVALSFTLLSSDERDTIYDFEFQRALAWTCVTRQIAVRKPDNQAGGLQSSIYRIKGGIVSMIATTMRKGTHGNRSSQASAFASSIGRPARGQASFFNAEEADRDWVQSLLQPTHSKTNFSAVRLLTPETKDFERSVRLGWEHDDGCGEEAKAVTCGCLHQIQSFQSATTEGTAGVNK
ncbi:hypothetical protein SCHPADRAFT_885851 [Schizopora paradoxa]|uniref:Uncharacterized protein n=1 Tax=Schizopora paradoxa TaxID=27342 RepID=A0A0H2SB84_9AGAM|nr:hypothetical protein SCHPADRAFT_885851 [Schizopora paradoxa]